MKTTLLLVLCAAAAVAQPLKFGAKAGVPLTDFYSTIQTPNFGFNSNTNRYIVGPTIELRLPFGLGVEFDALYRHTSYSGSSGTTQVNATAEAWEFPLLAKYRFPTPAVKPFVDAGITWDRLSGATQSVLSAVGVASREVDSTTTTGFVLGFGVEIPAVIVHISPEVRYTRWGSSKLTDPSNLVQASRNQAEFLLGITF